MATPTSCNMLPKNSVTEPIVHLQGIILSLCSVVTQDRISSVLMQEHHRSIIMNVISSLRQFRLDVE